MNEDINRDDEEGAGEDAEESYSVKVRRQIESNDPDLVELKIGHEGYLPGDWERVSSQVAQILPLPRFCPDLVYLTNTNHFFHF